jgi:tetratricopeptide (TPR) repeat protein
MSSIIEGYNYDIFISYRQKDNKGDMWVSEFVEALQTELESTFKEDISVYFDINPHDGLLETHDVDASLQEKLKCLIFIPIISRTYCDPKSFAWQHEFKAFVEQASQDRFGLKIKLPNGNVASRVLPVRIHDLDSEDIKGCETVLGGVLRGVEFIYKEPGVNKPLSVEDDENKNINKTKYRIQLNKTANAIKEIITGIKTLEDVSDDESVEHPVGIDKTSNGLKSEVTSSVGQKKVIKKDAIIKESRKKQINFKRIAWAAAMITIIISILISTHAFNPIPFSEDDWILITDFDNMTGNDIFDQSLNTALEITIQQSSFVNVFSHARINETLKRMGKEETEVLNEEVGIEVAQREGIKAIVVCSISLIGNIYLLTYKVVETSTKKILRTETFQAKGENEILVSLDQLARRLRRDLGESLRKIDHNIVPLPDATTSSLEALKYLAKGNEAWGNALKFDEAKGFYLKAIELDPEFAYAHKALGSIYYWNNNRVKGEEYYTKALNQLERLTEKEKLSIPAEVEKYRGNYEEAVLNYNIFLRSYPGSSPEWFSLGYCYMRLDRCEEAIIAFNKSVELFHDKEPSAYINIAVCYAKMEKYQQAVESYLKAFELNPKLLTVSNVAHEFGFTYVQMDQIQKAREVFENMTAGNDALKAQGYRSLALLLMYTGKISEAIDMLHESTSIYKTLDYGASELRNHLFLATAYRTKGMMPEFYEELNKVNKLLKTEGLEPWWNFLYGKLLVRDEKITATERELNEISAKIIKGNKSDTAAFLILKGEIQLARGNTAEALDLIETGVKLRQDGYTSESLANYYYRTGNLDMAILKYKGITDGRKQLGWEGQEYWIKAYYNLGKIYEKKGSYEQAMFYYKGFLTIWKDADDDIPELVDARTRLTKLQELEL